MTGHAPAHGSHAAVTPDMSRVSSIPALGRGNHHALGDGACFMEAVSFVAGEPWSDHPACVCPVIGAFLRRWNDDLPDADRDILLRPLIPFVLNTRSTRTVGQRRAMLAFDWLLREHAPAWLRVAGLATQADAVAGLPEITDIAQCPSLMPTLNAVCQDVFAAEDAFENVPSLVADAAAWDAATDAASVAAWDAAWASAGVVTSAAAGGAASNAAWVVARAATWNVARDTLKPTQEALQQSALALVHRMIAVTEAV